MMKGLWSKAFWKDAVERTVSAVAQSLLLFLTGDTLGNVLPGVNISVDFSDWSTWLTIIGGAALIQMLKNLVAATANPNSGASFGASVPATLVLAQTTVTGSKDGALPPGVPESRPGDNVIGPALAAQTDWEEGQRAQVTALPPAA
jgi:hypothetical protein